MAPAAQQQTVGELTSFDLLGDMEVLGGAAGAAAATAAADDDGDAAHAAWLESLDWLQSSSPASQDGLDWVDLHLTALLGNPDQMAPAPDMRA
jgi:hypothetical protein